MKVALLVLVVLFLLNVRAAWAESSGDVLWADLLDNPPAVPHTEGRLEALGALDKWLSVADSERTEAVVAYYQRSVEYALDRLENEKVAKGIRVFQLYSSSVIVQTPETVFAFDLDQGPNKKLDETPAEEGVAFRMADGQVERLARLVDVSFHSHEHYDHIDFEITRALLAAGKQVVVTQSNKDQWEGQPWAEKLTVLEQTVDKPHALGSLKVDVLHDFQWNDNEHTGGTPCTAYLVTTADGISVFSKGDINCGLRLYGWLSLMVEAGRHVDLFVGSPAYWRGVDVVSEIDALLAPVWAVGHVWEFTHRRSGKSGGATGTYRMNHRSVERVLQAGAAAALTWGECFDIERAKRGGKPPRVTAG
jgi:hypothetical protein